MVRHIISVTLPWPDKALSPNARVHWAVYAKAKRNAKKNAYLITRAAQPDKPVVPRDKPLIVDYVMRPRVHRRRDEDNFIASHKAALDGIAMALNVDDSRFKTGSIECGQLSPTPCVIITIKTE